MPTTLHRELITTPSDAPARWLILTHGIYGSGSNWRSIARKLVGARPGWGVALVDLRGHGRSPHGAPPHTLAACAEDLGAVVAALAAEGKPVAAIAGHSFGGKVALTLRAGAARPVQTWLLDSSPSPVQGAWALADNDVRDVWQMLRELPTRWARRDDFTAAVIGRGHRPEFAGWLGMSLAPDGDGVRLIFDLDQLRALLEDYYARDLWASLDDRDGGEVRVVIAQRSTTLSADDRARLAQLAAAGAPVHPHVIADAGHWLHIDAPAAVIALLAAHLPT